MRLIDADALMNEANSDGAYGYVDAKQISESPTVDATPVVRCRECKYSFYDEIFGNFWCNSHSGCRKVKDEGFCDLGERKGGAD